MPGGSPRRFGFNSGNRTVNNPRAALARQDSVPPVSGGHGGGYRGEWGGVFVGAPVGTETARARVGRTGDRSVVLLGPRHLGLRRSRRTHPTVFQLHVPPR